MNNVITYFEKNSRAQNALLTAGVFSALYLVKSTWSFISSYYKDKNEGQEIKAIIEKEKNKIPSEDLAKNETIFFMYYKILYTVYKKDFADFDIKRRAIFNSDNIEKYTTYVKTHLKTLK